MSGNVGSAQRREYTAIGDTANTASRLEQLTKGTPHQLFVSDSTKQAMRNSAEAGDVLVPVDEFQVRGRSERVMVWTAATPTGVAATPAAMSRP